MKLFLVGVAALAAALAVPPLTAQDDAWAPAVLLNENFEGADVVSAWPMSGLWWVDGTPASLPGGAAYSGSQSLNYNNGVDYDTGGINAGAALSPIMTISNFGRQTVTFRCNYRTETTGTAYDKRILNIYRADQLFRSITLSGRTDTGAGRCSAMGTWHLHTVEVPSMAPPGSRMAERPFPFRLEFFFDTVDDTINNHAGWFIDDVVVVQRRVNEPPVRDDHGNTMETATDITVGGPSVDTRPLDGRIERAGDVDFFKFMVPHRVIPPNVRMAPARIEIRTLGLPSGMDTFIHLYDQNGTELATDDDGGGGYASKIARAFPWNGQWYFVKVRHFSDSGTGRYKIEARFVELAPPPADDHGNTPETATSVPVNGASVNGSIETGGDVDYFHFAVPIPAPLQPYPTYVIETSELSGGMDTVIEIYTDDGNGGFRLVASNDDAPGLGLASRLTLSSNELAPHAYVKVRHYSGTGTGSYQLRVMQQQ